MVVFFANNSAILSQIGHSDKQKNGGLYFFSAILSHAGILLPRDCNKMELLNCFLSIWEKWWLSSSLFSPKFICFASINTYSCGRENILNLLIRNFSERKLYKNVILCRNVYYEYNFKKGKEYIPFFTSYGIEFQNLIPDPEAGSRMICLAFPQMFLSWLCSLKIPLSQGTTLCS